MDDDSVVHSSRSAVCYFSAVPVELLVSIFQFSVEDDPDASLRISGVHRHWRDVACSSADLWTSLRIGRHDPQDKAAAWLQRSRGHVYELEARYITGCAVYNDLRLAGRWPKLRSLKLEISDAGIGHEYFSNHPPGTPSYPFALKGLPELQRFEVSVPDVLVAITEHSEEAVARLQHLRIESAYLQFTKPYKTSSLRSLHLVVFQGTLSMPYLVTVLRQSIMLRTLHMQDIQAVHIHGRPPPAGIELPKLVSLELIGAITTSSLIGALRLPSLQRLVVTFHILSFTAVELLRPEDLSNLRELRLRNVLAQPSFLLPHIRLMARLTVLEISGCGADDFNSFIDELASTGLRLHEVDFSRSSNLSGQPLVRLLESFRDALHSMILDSCPRIEPDILLWLERRLPRFSCLQ